MGLEGAERASRTAAAVVLGYLVVAFPALFRVGVLNWWVVAGHIAGIAAFAWAVWGRVARGRSVADWLPLAAVPFLYAELPLLMGAAVYHDATIIGWEGWLFGGHMPARELAGAIPWVWLSELVHLGYLSYYALIFGPPLLLYLAGRRVEFGRTVLAVMGAFVACYVVFVLFPVEGPRYLWGAPAGVPNGPVRRLVLSILEGGSARGTAFPSSHAAVSTASAIMALKYFRSVGILALILTCLLLVGAVYGGFHYGIDMVVGAAVGGAVAGVVLWRSGKGRKLPDNRRRKSA